MGERHWFGTNGTKRRWIGFMGVVAIFVLSLALLPHLAFAQGITNASNATIGSNLGLGSNTDVRLIVIHIVQYLLGFLGLVAVLIVLYGGFLWMTAAGNEQRVEQAKLVLRNGFIGLVIILASYAIVLFIINFFLGVGNNQSVGLTFNGGDDCGFDCYSLGAGIVEDHYPDRDATGVPRNTKVIITFREEIFVDTTNPANPDSLIWNATTVGGITSGQLNTGVFTLKEKNPVGSPGPADMDVSTNDLKTFVFVPMTGTGANRKRLYLGNSNQDTPYIAEVTAALHKKVDADNNLQPDCGFNYDSVTRTCSGDYKWNFTVSTLLDLTPPLIKKVTPFDEDTSFKNNNPKNSGIVIDFSEAINPISATGVTSVGFNNIEVKNVTDGQPVAGKFQIGNGYRTVYFLSDQACGVNTCGQTMYCLPGKKTLSVTVKAATLLTQSQTTAPVTGPCTLTIPTGNNPNEACTPVGGVLYDGVTDVADNSFDGIPVPQGRLEDNNGYALYPTGNKPPKSDGQPLDNFVWKFSTSDIIARTGPTLLEVLPTPDDVGIDGSTPLVGHFNRTMLPLHGFADPSKKNTFLPPVKILQINSNGSYNPQGGYTTREDPHTDVNGNYFCSETPGTCGQGGGGSCPATGRCSGGGSDDGKQCSSNANCGSPDTCDFELDPNLCGQDDVTINHTPLALQRSYEPRFGSGIQDYTQNCFLPPRGPVGANNSLYPTGASCANVNDPNCYPNISPAY